MSPPQRSLQVPLFFKHQNKVEIREEIRAKYGVSKAKHNSKVASMTIAKRTGWVFFHLLELMKRHKEKRRKKGVGAVVTTFGAV